MSNATTESTLLMSGLSAMRFGRGFLKMLLEQTFDDLFYKPAFEGANHAAWVVGHLALTDNAFLVDVAGQDSKLPEEWNALFGVNTKAIPDPKKYPFRAELMSVLDERRAALESWLSTLSDAELLKPIEGDFGMFAANRAQLGSSCSFHDAFHAAQISATRRVSGLPPLF